MQHSAGTCPNSWRDGFARDCPLRHPVARVLALRDRSGAHRRFLVYLGRFSATSGGDPRKREAAGAGWRPVSGRSSREPVSVVRVGSVVSLSRDIPCGYPRGQVRTGSSSAESPVGSMNRPSITDGIALSCARVGIPHRVSAIRTSDRAHGRGVLCRRTDLGCRRIVVATRPPRAAR